MADPGALTIRISAGEVIDRLTILEIKAARIGDAAKLANVRHELDGLAAAARAGIPDTPEVAALHAGLRAVNEKLWDIEDDIRGCERRGDFGADFIALARAVYRTNDERAALKRRINDLLGTDIVEEKSYAPY